MLCGVVRITGESLDMLMVPAKPLAPCPFRRAPLLQAKHQKPNTCLKIITCSHMFCPTCREALNFKIF
jgi:hypothetical protein